MSRDDVDWLVDDDDEIVPDESSWVHIQTGDGRLTTLAVFVAGHDEMRPEEHGGRKIGRWVRSAHLAAVLTADDIVRRLPAVTGTAALLAVAAAHPDPDVLRQVRAALPAAADVPDESLWVRVQTADARANRRANLVAGHDEMRTGKYGGRKIGRWVRPADLAAAMTAADVVRVLPGSVGTVELCAIAATHPDPDVLRQVLASIAPAVRARYLQVALERLATFDGLDRVAWWTSVRGGLPRRARRAVLLHAAGVPGAEWRLAAIQQIADVDLGVLASLRSLGASPAA